MIVFDQFVFASAPCTGTPWFLRVCQELKMQNVALLETSFEPPPPGFDEKLVLSFVRHPATWLESFFDEWNKGPIGIQSFDMLWTLKQQTQSFYHFLDCYLNLYQGYVSEVFRSFKTDTAIKYENINEGVGEFLLALGFQCPSCYSQTLVTPIKSHIHVGKCDRSLRKRILQAEPTLVELYDYY